MNAQKRLFVEMYTDGTSFPVYDEIVDVNTLQNHVQTAMFDAPETGRVFADRVGSYLDAQIGGYYIMGVFVAASTIYRTLSDADEQEADDIFDDYVEVASYDITQKLLERGLCDVDNRKYCVSFRLMEVEE